MREVQDALALARATGDVSAELDLLGTAARATHDLGDDRQALEIAGLRVERARATDWQKQWKATFLLGHLYHSLDLPARALEVHQEALGLLAGQFSRERPRRPSTSHPARNTTRSGDMSVR